MTSSVTPSRPDLVAALKMALRIAEDGAGTMPAKEAVKLRPRDWHKIGDLIRALASEPEPQPVAGPTEAMIEAGELALFDCYHGYDDDTKTRMRMMARAGNRSRAVQCFKAMIAASPHLAEEPKP